MENNKMSKVDKILNEKYNEMVEFYYKEGYSKSETISKVDYLVKEGFELANILTMQKKYPEFLKFDVKNNLEGIRNLKQYGFNDELIKSLMINNPILFILSKRYSEAVLSKPLSKENNIKENYAKLLYYAAKETYKTVKTLEKEVGYYTAGALKISDYFHLDANLLFGLPKDYPERFNKIVNKLIEYGYSKPSALYITSMCPKTLNNFNKSKDDKVELPKNIDLLEKLNYTKEDIIKMTKLYPSLLKVEKEDIRDTLRYFTEEGYRKDEIKLITTTNPEIFGKIGGLKIIENIFIDDNPELIDELKTISKRIEKDYNQTYRRYQYLKDNGYIVDKNNFKVLFGNDHDFATRYGVTDKLLHEKYDPFNGVKKSFNKLIKSNKIPKRIKKV